MKQEDLRCIAIILVITGSVLLSHMLYAVYEHPQVLLHVIDMEDFNIYTLRALIIIYGSFPLFIIAYWLYRKSKKQTKNHTHE